MVPTEGQEESLVFPSRTSTALWMPRCGMAREVLATPSSPGLGDITPILLEQGLAMVGCWWEAARLGLAKEHLPSIVWSLEPSWGPSRATQAGLCDGTTFRPVSPAGQGQVTTV